jgi:hypothetical protein
LTDDLFEILNQTQNAVISRIVWDDTLGKYIYPMPGGKTKKRKTKSKRNKKNKNKNKKSKKNKK